MHGNTTKNDAGFMHSIILLSFTKQTLWKSLKIEGERTRTALKVLETLTYSCTSPQDLHILGSKVEELITNFRIKLPKSEGIILRPEARKSVRKRAQQILKKYRPLPPSVRRGRQKSDWHYRNRVGQKASELRKVCIFNTEVYSALGSMEASNVPFRSAYKPTNI